MNDFDQHESGQLRIGTAGDQLPLLPLPDAAIPASDGPELASPALERVGDSPEEVRARADYLRMTRAEADAEARARLSR